MADPCRGLPSPARVIATGWCCYDPLNLPWFWSTIVEGLLTEPPAEALRPARAADEDLVDAFVAQAARLVQVLREADQAAPCWTWAGWQQDVDFVTRHQVQEAAVHHWDVVHAGGDALVLDSALAADALDEFLHFSVASDDDPDEPVKSPLDGLLAVRATDTGDTWTLTDGRRPGTVRVSDGADPGAPVVQAPAAELLLWLYGRAEIDTEPVPPELIARFRAMAFTD